MTARPESPAERFTRKQVERDAERAARSRLVKAHPALVKDDRYVTRKPSGVHGKEYARVTADLVQRHGVVQAARELGESQQTVRNRLKRHNLDACHPELHARDYATRHGLATWERVK
jgi:hypothetical protein